MKNITRETLTNLRADPDARSLSPDSLRLLHAVRLYTDGPNRPWLKDFSISVMVHLGVTEGLFERYDLSPSLVDFRGIKMFARISQEAIGDLDLLFRRELVERMIMNTRYYAPTTATRISMKGEDLLKREDSVCETDRQALDRILRCPGCGQLLDFAVGREYQPVPKLVVTCVCACISNGMHRQKDFWHCGVKARERLVEGFFSIGTVAYKSKPCFLGGQDHGQ